MANSEISLNSGVHSQVKHSLLKRHASHFILNEQSSPVSSLDHPKPSTLVESLKQNKVIKACRTYRAHRRNCTQIRPAIKKQLVLKKRSSLNSNSTKNESWDDFHKVEPEENFSILVETYEKDHQVHSVWSKNGSGASRIGRQILKTNFATRHNSLE